MVFDGDPLAFYGKLIIEEHHASLLANLPPHNYHPKLRIEGRRASLLDNLPLHNYHPELRVKEYRASHLDNLPPHDYRSELLRVETPTSQKSSLSRAAPGSRVTPGLKVGVLGAGIGGLYTALILDSLDIPYEILEASGRAGGRISTYHFHNKGKYDYFDEGAMRYPFPKKNARGKYKNGTTKRLAELIEYPPLNQGSDPLKRTLIPYYFKARKSEGSRPGFYYFNGQHQPVSYDPDAHRGSFKAQDMGVSDDYIQAGSTAIHNDVINPFVRSMMNDLRTGKTSGWNLLKANDSYSVRGYMASKYLPSYSLKLPPTHLPNDVINWCNLLEDSSGGYDRALTEEVFDSLAFAKVGDNDYGDVEWKCFEGGSETLIKKMVKYIESKGPVIKYNKKVTAIYEDIIKIPDLPRSRCSCDDEDNEDEDKDKDEHSTSEPIAIVRVKVKGSSESEQYSHVISTLPLPVLRTIDLKNAGLNVLQRNALRALDYGPSLKIAILFKSNWWTTKLNIVGGQSFTDLPIRTIVYPSYGVDSKTPSKVLIASYTWTTDASRLGALALKDKELLKELVLRNLAEAHGYYNEEITYEFLQIEYEGMHVKDWNADEYAMGGYAKFSPGEFENLYTSLSFPAANQCLHFAGEAVSTRHSWIVGALDSAWRAVYEYLTITSQSDKLHDLEKNWGANKEWTTRSRFATNGQKQELLEEHIGLVNKAILAGII